MIVYGTKAVHLKTAKSNTCVCPSCGTKGQTEFSVYSKHAHIFWIPIFPYGKEEVSQCQHCQHYFKGKDMPADIKRESNEVKSSVRPKIWQFAGLVILAVGIPLIIINGNRHKEEVAQFIKAPLVDDIYECKMENGYFSTMKVYEVTDDSVFVIPNDMETNKRSGITDIDKEENYADWYYGIGYDDLQDMYASGEVFDVNR